MLTLRLTLSFIACAGLLCACAVGPTAEQSTSNHAEHTGVKAAAEYTKPESEHFLQPEKAHPTVRQPVENPPLADLPDLPDEIALHFKPLEWRPLQEGSAKDDWSKAAEFPFAQFGNQHWVLEVYEQKRQRSAEIVSSLPSAYYAILRLVGGEASYLIGDTLSQEVVAKGLPPTTPKYLPGQARYQLVGSVPLFANGPGRTMSIYYDHEDNQWLFSEYWGELLFADLDGDGNEEIVLQFPGLHLQWPDVSLMRKRADSDQWEGSDWIVAPLRRYPLDSAWLRLEPEPRIEISGTFYRYDRGSDALVKVRLQDGDEIKQR